MPDLPPSPIAPKAYYPALDGLRALAILMVFHFHYTAAYRSIGSPIAHWGWIGVDLFFVLSGFLITGILYDTRGRKHAYRDFMGRRMLRIFPLYYAVWTFFILSGPLFHWIWPVAGWMWPLYLGNFARFLHPGNLQLNTNYFYPLGLNGTPGPPLDVSHFWTLCVEEQFYLIWPLVMLFVQSRRLIMGIILSLLVLLPLARTAIALWGSSGLVAAELLYRATPLRVDALLWGALLAILLREHGALLHHWGRTITLTAGAGLLVYMVLRKLMDTENATYLYSPWNGSIGYVVIDVFAFGLVLELIRADSRAARVFSWPPARRLGQISYGVYALHFLPHALYLHLAQHAFHRPDTAPVDAKTMYGYEALAFVVTLLLATASFHLLETPFLRLKRYFPGQTHTAPSA